MSGLLGSSGIKIVDVKKTADSAIGKANDALIQVSRFLKSQPQVFKAIKELYRVKGYDVPGSAFDFSTPEVAPSQYGLASRRLTNDAAANVLTLDISTAEAFDIALDQSAVTIAATGNPSSSGAKLACSLTLKAEMDCTVSWNTDIYFLAELDLTAGQRVDVLLTKLQSDIFYDGLVSDTRE